MKKVINNKLFIGLVALAGFSISGIALAASPIVNTLPATSVTASSATLNASLVSDGGHTVTSAGFQFGENQNYNNTVSANVPNYAFESMFGSSGWGMQPGTFNQPMDIAINASTGKIYIIEQNGSSSRVQIYTSAGVFESQFGGVGTGNGQFDTTGGVALDQSGNVYVTDYANNRVQKFTADGAYISQFGGWGFEGGSFYGPSGIAIDSSGNILVVDTQNNRVQKFDSNGNFIFEFGAAGSGNGEFNIPWGIDVDQDGNIYVVDAYNHRVQKFNQSGEYLAQFGGQGSANGQFFTPYGIDVDQGGMIVVGDSGNSRVQIFNSDLSYATQFGVYNGNNPVGGEFFGVGGVAVDATGAIYASDINNSRIQKFSRKFSATTSSLKCGKVFHYRAFATSVDGTGYGNDRVFSTPACITTVRPVTEVVGPAITRPTTTPVLKATVIDSKIKK